MNNTKKNAIVEKMQNLGMRLENVHLSPEVVRFNIKVKAKTNTKIEGVVISNTGELIVATRVQPIEGRANESIIEMLADHFGIAARDVQLLRGERGKSKLFALSLHFRHNRDVTYFLNKLELWG